MPVIDESIKRVEASWEELTRQYVLCGNRNLLVLLYGKTSKLRVPLPRGHEETEFQKILLVDVSTSNTIASINLSIWACYRLLSMDSANELQLNDSSLLTIQEIM